MKRLELEEALRVALVVGSILGDNPWACAGVILTFSALRIADKYFHHSFFDENRKQLNELRAEFIKIKSKQDKDDLKSAFGGKNG